MVDLRTHITTFDDTPRFHEMAALKNPPDSSPAGNPESIRSRLDVIWRAAVVPMQTPAGIEFQPVRVAEFVYIK